MLALVLTLAACTPKPVDSGAKVTSNGFACPEPSPRVKFDSTEINIFTWTEYVPQDIIDCFGLVYGVKMNVDYFSSNEELNAKMTTGKEVNRYDVIHPSDYIIDVLAREGVLAPLDQSRIPNWKNLNTPLLAAYGDKTKYVVPYQMGTQAIVYNSETVTDPPKSWADLWSPDYKGRIVSVDDMRVVIGVSLLTLGYGVNDTDPAHLDQAKQKLIELMPNIRVFDSDSPKTALVAGDVDLGIVWNGEAFLAQQENPAFQYVFPTEGTIIFYDGMALPVNAPHPDAAYAWFNYLLQGDVNWLTLVDYPYTNPNQAALDFARANHPDVYEAYIGSPITNSPPDVFASGHDVEDLGNALPLYDEIWTEVKQ
jgi:spermidine/putrescine-binding protein